MLLHLLILHVYYSNLIACMKEGMQKNIHNTLTQDMVTQKPSNWKVKLGWGWYPQALVLQYKVNLLRLIIDHFW